MRLDLEPNVTAMRPAIYETSGEAPITAISAFEDALNNGIAAAKNGDRKAARELLTEAADLNAFSEDAWMWLASISEYPEELIAFLSNVLAVNPANVRAKKWLAETESLREEVVENCGQEDFEIEDITNASIVLTPATVPTNVLTNGAACPFCSAQNEATAFGCRSCRAVLTLSDIEAVLSTTNADRETIQRAVTKMEAEWNLRDFDGRELTLLGIGYLNLRSYDEGLKYLNEALLLEPNNVILSGQINTLSIRLDEMRRQGEAHESKVKGKNILVVDDSATVRKLISSKLEKAGHNVTCAGDGVEALAMIAKSLPDIMFLDISMPLMDGYEVCKQVRSNPSTKHLPIVMISGKDGFFDKVRGRMAGTTDYITKPFGPDAVMRALETYLVPERNPVSEQ